MHATGHNGAVRYPYTRGRSKTATSQSILLAIQSRTDDPGTSDQRHADQRLEASTDNVLGGIPYFDANGDVPGLRVTAKDVVRTLPRTTSDSDRG